MLINKKKREKKIKNNDRQKGSQKKKHARQKNLKNKTVGQGKSNQVKISYHI
jgi:hypothetical protein